MSIACAATMHRHPVPPRSSPETPCEGCGASCGPDDVLVTASGRKAICQGCWDRWPAGGYTRVVRATGDRVGRRQAKDAKKAGGRVVMVQPTDIQPEPPQQVDPEAWNPHYLAYAAAHGHRGDPDGMRDADRQLFRGGTYARYLVWIREQERAFKAHHALPTNDFADSGFHRLTDEQLKAFTAWLADRTAEHRPGCLWTDLRLSACGYCQKKDAS